MAFHAVNILLYAACAVLAFVLACQLLPRWAAFVVGALFAVDPVHVEAVANVVGQSELIVAAAVLWATLLYVGERRSGAFRPRIALAVAGLYLIACFGKEHGVVLPAILLAAELLLVDDRRPIADRVRHLRPFYLILAALGVAFIGVRSVVLSSRGIGGFVPFGAFTTLHISATNRVFTAFGIVPQWIRLLLWPAHLAADYSPPGIPIAQGFELWVVPGLVLLVAIVTIAVVLARRQPVISFGIAFVCIALLPSSNFILPAGLLLAERTLFLPSVGAMLVVGGAIAWSARVIESRSISPWLPRAAAVLAAALVAAAGIRSARRSTVWKDNARLLAQAVVDAPWSYRTHYLYGTQLFETKHRAEGEIEYRKSLALFPYDPSVSFGMAQQYYLAGLCGPALPLYRWTRQLDPDYPQGRTPFAICLLDQGHPAEAKAVALDATRFGIAIPLLRSIIAAADSAQAADTVGKGSVPHDVTLAGHTGRSPQTVQNAAGQHAPQHVSR